MLAKYIHTIRYLKPIQIYSRVKFCITSPRVDLRPRPELRVPKGVWSEPIKKEASLLGPSKFRFLSVEHDLDSSTHWDNLSWGRLWIYHLHYFDDLNARDSASRCDWHCSLLQRWVRANPPSVGSGWEPYPTSLRIVNWVKWVLAGNSLSEELLHSLAVQTRFLYNRLETHLMGNHLFANAKALIFSGIFFCGSEAQKWLDKGLRILIKQIPEQILSDGGHFERSPMYHSIILEDLLDLLNILKTYSENLPSEWRRFEDNCRTTIQRMRHWLKNMTHPDGQISLFNDAAFGVSASPGEIDQYAQRLGLGLVEDLKEGNIFLKESGYVRLQRGPAVLIADVGEIGPNYLPGHAHADTLSFELSLFGNRVIVDTGTSCYEKSEERLRQRSTTAHNTVLVNGENSSEVWSSFRVARRAKPFDLKIESGNDFLRVKCAHDGYKRLPGRPIHFREWILKENELIVHDTVMGSFKNAQARFHFYPTMTIEKSDSVQEGTIFLGSNRRVKWKIETGDGSIEDSTFHPEFGVSVRNTCLKITFNGNISRIVFRW